MPRSTSRDWLRCLTLVRFVQSSNQTRRNSQSEPSFNSAEPRLEESGKIPWPSDPETPISRPGNKHLSNAVNKSTHLVLDRTNEKYPSRNPLHHTLRYCCQRGAIPSAMLLCSLFVFFNIA